ncbi:MAG: hypothetical protein A3I61_18520 [Acidobacteria bacterium RIFCSPLOWO2_02_FULL_68_18]|nr:MAG: hypothetical protein A3I61_18520 [Acidobacteria bacterium RIFCSPLOWO2_02_FULL_68_18]OFW48043.1 MAG: hypothetical protein A3G77_11135 [Acidobacteria bacterium RIFCSPLOWO2_12_FULL_68_19]
MGILEKLRPQPRWKHADPSVRVASVYDLGAEDTDALHALAREDPEPRVRRAAVSRIDEVPLLAEVARTDPDEEVRAEAVRGLAGIGAEADAPAQALEAVRQLLTLGRTKEVVLVARDTSSVEVRTGVVDLVDHQKTLAAISRHARDGATRLLALARLADAGEILTVALKAEHTDAAVAALERITALEALTEVAQRARNKVAARRARARLRLQTEEAPPGADTGIRMSAEERQRALDLLRHAEGLVAVADPDEAGTALAAVRLSWAELQADVECDPALVQQFETAIEAVREAIAQRREERLAEQERARALAREQADRIAICEEIEALSEAGAADRIAELKVRWDGLPPMPSEYAASLTRRFQNACRAFADRERRRLLAEAAAARLDTLATELEQLASSGQSADDVIARWRGLRRDADVLREHAAANPAAAARVEQAVAQLEAREQQQAEVRSRREQENLRRLQQLGRHVETLAAAEQITLKAGSRALREIRTALETRPPLPTKKDWQEVQTRLEAAHAALAPRVTELREADEWQRWANLQVQEELCREMETLKAEADFEAASRRMRELQARWKPVALAPRAQGEAMWRRFKAAQDEVFERVAPYFAAQIEERAANLARKQAICERAEALAASTDWVRTAVEIQALQAEWKRIGPVTRGQEKATWERFRAACDHFFTRRQQDLRQRKETWAANLARKEGFCVRAEALADSTDWEACAAELRQLQAEWKTVGPVRRSKSEAIWKRFRDACDRFFERYKHRDQVELAAKAAPRESIVHELEHLLPAAGAEAPAPDGLYALVQQARQRWHQAPELPRHMQQDLAMRYHQALGRLVAIWPAAFSGTDLDPEATRQRMEKLVARVEEVAPASGQPAAKLTPAELLARQWRERLAANTIGGGRGADTEESRGRSAEQAVREAQAQWMRLGPVSPEVAGPLHERFQRACRRFYEQRRRAS